MFREWLPFAHLNLRRNPFGAVPEGDWERLTIPRVDVDRLASRLESPGFAVQLRGPCGRGKSTNLRALHDRFPSLPLTYVAEGTKPPIPKSPVVFVDEIQRIPYWRRALLFRRRASFAIATHGDHQRELRAAGLQVESFEVGGADAGHLASVVSRRIEWARRSVGPVPEVEDEAIRWLVERYGDDLRAIESCLYDVFQDMKGVGRVEVRHLDRAARG